MQSGYKVGEKDASQWSQETPNYLDSQGAWSVFMGGGVRSLGRRVYPESQVRKQTGVGLALVIRKRRDPEMMDSR